ncbi:helix-turn-helix transcriptional regulator [Psychrobacter immobilis]|uniref:Putative DNA-binding transcriptional regulator YafY n=1 Tax=Psychrobacter immobilis TaxID=498 RepID=A0A2V1ZXG5_PSYIM|nr:WYL domain-containing protein [Psychrobacter immobilis]PWK10134.1 putative DNA-binding transcriptional regulator YafY [Psychrobacter immobilis]
MELKKHERLAYRLSDIIVRLNNGERLDIFELADIYKVSIRTLKRDFQDRLTVLDFSEAGPQFYCLNAKKIGYLDIADIKRFANFASVQDLLPKIDRQFFQEQINQSILVKGFAYEDISARTNEFKAINQAITDCQYIEFDYCKISGSASDSSSKHHHLEPYHLLNKNGIWYVVGCRHGQTRTFCFTQIANLQVNNKTFAYSEDIKEKILGTDSLFFGNQISEVVLQIDAKVAGYFERRDLLPNQELLRKLDNGDLLLICKDVHPREVVPIVQYWIPHIRVITPSSVQTQIQDLLESYLEKL